MEFRIDGLMSDDDNERHVTVSKKGSRVMLSTGIVGGNVYEATLKPRTGARPRPRS